MSQRRAMQALDTDIATALLDAGMADAAQYHAPGAVPVPCTVLVDREAQFYEDSTDIVGRRVVITLYLSEIPAPVRHARVLLADGEAFRLDARIAGDESLQKWVVTHG